MNAMARSPSMSPSTWLSARLSVAIRSGKSMKRVIACAICWVKAGRERHHHDARGQDHEPVIDFARVRELALFSRLF